MNGVPTTERLQQHQDRRARGTPTATALVGPVGLSARAWRAWATGRSCTIADGAEGALRIWVATAFEAADPVQAAVRWATTTFGQLADDLARATRYDVEALWSGLPADPRAPAASAAFLLLTDRACGAAPDPTRFVRALGGPGGDAARVVRAVAGLTPPDRLPPLLLIPPRGGLPAALRLLEAVASAEPRLPVGVAVARDEYDGFLVRSAGTRAAALAREGFVEVEGVSGNELEARLRAAGLEPPGAVVERLAADGLADEVAEAFVGAVRAVRAPTPADLASDFRSVHEAFLFGLLESVTQTAGLFRPNQPLPFAHGSRAAEADLLAAALKLAVEVDGGFYHLNPDQYRRDRRKDYLYQRHGYLVLRFLAEDVVADLERILDTILGAVAARRGPPQPAGDA
ncbi:MAG TPA: DUF559 domain-containing protein [Gemmata sp.]